MSKRHSEQFKQQVIQHALSHPEQTKVSIAHLFGLGHSTLDKWMRTHHQQIGAVASAVLILVQASLESMRVPRFEDVGSVWFACNNFLSKIVALRL